MKHFGSIDELASAPADRLTDVDDVGSVTADAVRAFFDDEQNIRIIDRLKEAGVNMKMEEPAKQAEQIFEGKTFVITGTLPSMDRKAAAALIEERGGKISGSVSKKTDYLLAGEAAGSKLTKAQQLGTTIIDEDEFRKMIGR